MAGPLAHRSRNCGNLLKRRYTRRTSYRTAFAAAGVVGVVGMVG